MSRWHARLAQLRAANSAGGNGGNAENSAVAPADPSFSHFSHFSHFSQAAELRRGIAAAIPEKATEPFLRWLHLVQTWGASINEAGAVVRRLCTAAGSPGTPRRVHVGELFAKMENYHRWAGSRRIKWLKTITNKMQRKPMYWPASRRDQTAAGRKGPDAILRVMKRAPKRRWTKAALQQATGMSKAVIANLMLSTCEAGEIIRVAPGVFVLPRTGVQRHVPVSVAIVMILLKAPAHQATTAQLAARIGGTRNAVDSAAHRMAQRVKKKGLLVRVGLGVFALSRETLNKIERGDSLRVGQRLLVPNQLSMWPAFDN
jgi:hypothetical protein